MSKMSPTYLTWISMKSRCNNPRHISFSRYGGRGITICTQWKTFAGFQKEMGERPQGTSIDRLDNNGNYYKENCRWATQKEQCRNRSNGKGGIFVLKNGERVIDVAQRIGIKFKTLEARLRSGWDEEKALTTPVKLRRCFKRHGIENLSRKEQQKSWRKENRTRIRQYFREWYKKRNKSKED